MNSNQNNNNCGLGNFPTSITGVSAAIVTISPPMNPPLVGYTPTHGNGSGPWGGQMLGVAGLCDTAVNAGGGNTPDEVVYYFQNATGGTLLFHQTQYACWINQTLNISAGGNCCIQPPVSTICPTITVTGTPTNIQCVGQTGSATASASGSTTSYIYNWMPGNLTGASQTGLSAGTYTVTATDGNGCTGTTTVIITQPASAVSVSVTGTTSTTCGSSTGSATANATGGTGTITYNWMPGSISGATASNLASGTYTVTATDANGCTSTTTAIVGSSGGPTVSISSQTNVLCNGGSNGSATASATGGTGTITYAWSGGAGTSATANNLTAGTYTVTATDGTGCANATTVTITQPAAIVVTVSTTPATCGNSDGTATVNATGGNGVLSPTWNTSATTSTITALAAGTYTVTITDVDGCTATNSGTVSVTGNLSGVNAGTDVTIIAGTSTQLNGTVPFGATILWTPSTGLSCTTCEDPLASPTQTTIYILTANQNGCTGSDTVIVYVDVICGELFVPTAFSPNEDGQNDFVYVMGNCITNLEFFIYDRWGEKVFETKDAAYGWDGTYRGKKMDAAVFVYYLTAIINGQEVTKQGNITLIK
jgi:gliding motility-associated-like protein